MQLRFETDGEVFVVEHAHYEDFAEALMELELEDDAFADYNNALTHLIGFCHSIKNVYHLQMNSCAKRLRVGFVFLQPEIKKKQEGV